MSKPRQKSNAVLAGSLPRRPTLDLHISSVLDEATDAVTQLGDWLDAEQVDPECIGDITLVLAESLNNVIEHAYSFQEDGLIEIKVRMRAEAISLQILDGGVPFVGPPDTVKLDQPSDILDDLPESGFGWFLIQNLTDDIHFSHDAGKNKLTLVLALRLR